MAHLRWRRSLVLVCPGARLRFEAACACVSWPLFARISSVTEGGESFEASGYVVRLRIVVVLMSWGARLSRDPGRLVHDQG